MRFSWIEIATLVATGALIRGACFIEITPVRANSPSRHDVRGRDRVQTPLRDNLSNTTQRLRDAASASLLASATGILLLHIPTVWIGRNDVPRNPDAAQSFLVWSNTLSTIGGLIFLAGKVSLLLTLIQTHRRSAL